MLENTVGRVCFPNLLANAIVTSAIFFNTVHAQMTKRKDAWQPERRRNRTDILRKTHVGWHTLTAIDSITISCATTVKNTELRIDGSRKDGTF